MDRLQHHKDVVGTVFDFGPLVPMTAVLYMERVKTVALRQNIQLLITWVLKIMPDQTELLRN